MQLVPAFVSALLVQSSVALADDSAFVTASPHAGSAVSDLYPPAGSMCYLLTVD